MSPAAEVPIEDLWTVPQVMKFLNLKRTAVYERVNAGELPHLRIGNQLRFVPAQIRQWVAEKSKTVARATVVPIGARR